MWDMQTEFRRSSLEPSMRGVSLREKKVVARRLGYRVQVRCKDEHGSWRRWKLLGMIWLPLISTTTSKAWALVHNLAQPRRKDLIWAVS
jgi:hypothetical protein